MQPLWKIVWTFLRKLKIEFLYDPTTLLLGIYLEKTLIQKHTCTLMFIATLLIIAMVQKYQMNGSRRCGICTPNGILLSHKKNDIMPSAATWVDLEIIILSVESQKDKYNVLLICGI